VRRQQGWVAPQRQHSAQQHAPHLAHEGRHVGGGGGATCLALCM
jgi:hypothetical protein